MSSILSVSQINTYIALKLRSDQKLRGIAVKGEISNLSRNSASGHIFFSLRDSGSVIKAVMFSRRAEKLRFMPFDGMSVIAYGNIDVYEAGGVYQINVSQLLPDGEGSAYIALLKLKEKLDVLGVFSAPKRQIPRYPEKIALVTSAGGAAVGDVKSIVARRYPAVKLELFPTLVQGAEAPQSIVKALERADSSGADTIILTRGGGSAEDLSAFNVEAVVMAVYGCKTPIISAVGHEINWTLCDLAADLRAPTPSGAAELATPDIADMRRELSSLRDMLKSSAAAKISSFRDVLRRYEYALSAFSVKEKLASRQKELAALRDAVEQHMRHRLGVEAVALSGLRDMLSSLDPKNVISRGYALVYKEGKIVPDAAGLSVGDGVKLLMRGGSAGAEIKNIKLGDDDEV